MDYTADWCLNCKTNEKAFIETEAVRKALVEMDILPMVADWTEPTCAKPSLDPLPGHLIVRQWERPPGSKGSGQVRQYNWVGPGAPGVSALLKSLSDGLRDYKIVERCARERGARSWGEKWGEKWGELWWHSPSPSKLP